MKKIIALLLVTVVCLCVSACSGGKDIHEIEASTEPTATTSPTEPTVPAETKPQCTTTEITLDNWEEYFEIRIVAAEQINAFGECSGIGNDIRLCLKEEHKNSVVDMDVAVEYTCTDGYSCWFTYNKETGEIVEGEKITYSASDPIPLVMDVSNIFAMKQANIEQGTSLLYWGVTVSNAEWDGNIATFEGSMYSNIEIVRIQGTITISA